MGNFGRVSENDFDTIGAPRFGSGGGVPLSISRFDQMMRMVEVDVGEVWHGGGREGGREGSRGVERRGGY